MFPDLEHWWISFSLIKLNLIRHSICLDHHILHKLINKTWISLTPIQVLTFLNHNFKRLTFFTSNEVLKGIIVLGCWTQKLSVLVFKLLKDGCRSHRFIEISFITRPHLHLVSRLLAEVVEAPLVIVGIYADVFLRFEIVLHRHLFFCFYQFNCKSVSFVHRHLTCTFTNLFRLRCPCNWDVGVRFVLQKFLDVDNRVGQNEQFDK